MNRCKICGGPAEKGKRRLLESQLSTQCRNTITCIASQCQPDLSADELRSFYSSGYACMTCSNSTDKYLRAKEHFQRLEQELTDIVTKAPLTPEDAAGIRTSTASRGTKRKTPDMPQSVKVK